MGEPGKNVRLAVQAFRQSRLWRTFGPATRLEIEVRAATTRHVVTVGQVRRWTEGAAASPAERLKRDRVRAMVGAPGHQVRRHRWALAVRRVNRDPLSEPRTPNHGNLISG